jgi:hypothetical protein
MLKHEEIAKNQFILNNEFTMGIITKVRKAHRGIYDPNRKFNIYLPISGKTTGDIFEGTLAASEWTAITSEEAKKILRERLISNKKKIALLGSENQNIRKANKILFNNKLVIK